MAGSCSSSGWGRAPGLDGLQGGGLGDGATPMVRLPLFFELAPPGLGAVGGPRWRPYLAAQFIRRAAVSFLEALQRWPGPVVAATNGSTLVSQVGRHQRGGAASATTPPTSPWCCRCARGKRCCPSWVPSFGSGYLFQAARRLLDNPALLPAGGLACRSGCRVPGAGAELTEAAQMSRRLSRRAGWGRRPALAFLPVPDFDQVCLSWIHAGSDPDRSGPNPWQGPPGAGRPLDSECFLSVTASRSGPTWPPYLQITPQTLEQRLPASLLGSGGPANPRCVDFASQRARQRSTKENSGTAQPTGAADLALGSAGYIANPAAPGRPGQRTGARRRRRHR